MYKPIYQICLLFFFGLNTFYAQSQKETDFGFAEYEVVYKHYREPVDGKNTIVLNDTKEVIDYDKILKNYSSTLSFNNAFSKYETQRTQSLSRFENIFGDTWVWHNQSYYNCLPYDNRIKEKISKGGIEYIDDIHKIEWTITAEETIINGIKCIKANGLKPAPGFLPEVYTAWYTPDIPVPFGPNEINGLPGLVVKYKWTIAVVEASSITRITDKKVPLKLPKTKNIINSDESTQQKLKLREEALKNRQ